MSELDLKVYNGICQIVYQQSGINLGSGKQALVHTRLGKRLRALNLDSHESYLHYLEHDQSGDEIVQLLDVISTNHTYFFREPDHFDVLADLIKEKINAGVRRLRIWCAAASSGEEPYTLSMVAQDACGTTPVDLRILATDISTKVLRMCVRGEYPSAKIKEIPEALQRRWWDRVDNDVWSASAELRRPLTFSRMNLMEVPYAMKGPFDIIFCRNVMIYFDRTGREKIVKESHRLLSPRGLLIVGHSESLTGMCQGFKSIKPSVYERLDH